MYWPRALDTMADSSAAVRFRKRAAPGDRSWVLLLWVAVVSVVVGTIWVLATPPSLADGVWFARVAARVAAGDVIYRDLWTGVTPLSVWLLALLTKVLGPTLVPINIFSVTMFVLTAVLATRIGQVAMLSSIEIVGVVSAIFIASPASLPGANGGYNTASVPIMLAMLLATIVWWQRRDEHAVRQAVVAGLVAGVSFGVKQNIGVFLLAAFFAAVITAPSARRLWFRSLAGASMAFAAVVGLVGFAIWRTGSLRPGLVELFGKSDYLAKAGISLLRGAGLAWTQAKFDAVGLEHISTYLYVAGYAFVVLGILLPVVGVFRDRAGLSRIAVIFGVTALVSSYPRFDISHIQVVVPLSIVCMFLGWAAIRSEKASKSLPMRVGVGVAMSLVVLGTAGVVHQATIGRDYIPQAVYGLGRVSPVGAKSVTNTIDALNKAPGQRVLIVSQLAGLYYLSTGLQNPTPWDYPLMAALPPDTIIRIKRKLNAHAIDAVWLDSTLVGSPFEPKELQEFTRTRMRLVLSTPEGQLFVPIPQKDSSAQQP